MAEKWIERAGLAERLPSEIDASEIAGKPIDLLLTEQMATVTLCHVAMRDLVRDANRIRWYNPALRNDVVPQFTHFDPDNRVLAFLRWNLEGNVVLTVVNLSDNQWDTATYGVAAGAPGEQWTEFSTLKPPNMVAGTIQAITWPV